jgi:hypothetical protein
MPQKFKEIEEEVKKIDIKSYKIVRGFSLTEFEKSILNLQNFYKIDDRIGFIIRLLKEGLNNLSYHNVIIVELNKLRKQLKDFEQDPDFNKELYEKLLNQIQKVISSPPPEGYNELIEILNVFRIKMFRMEEKGLSILNEQFRRLIEEYPELFPDIPIEYTNKDEDFVKDYSYKDYYNLIKISYELLKNMEIDNAEKIKELLKDLNQYINMPPNPDEKDVIGYAKYLINLLLQANDKQILRAKEVIKISIVFQFIIRFFIIKLKMDYPGDSARIRFRQEYYRSK